MKKLIAATMILALAAPALAQSVSVRGHIRKDGVYVPPHTRSAPNSTTLDNWSTKPNVNPTTGRAGTVDPYKLPTLPKRRN